MCTGGRGEVCYLRVLSGAGAEQAKHPAAAAQTQVTVEPATAATTTTTEVAPPNALSVPSASDQRRPSIELIPALADLGRAAPPPAAGPGDALLASEEDSMSEADSPSALDEHTGQTRCGVLRPVVVVVVGSDLK